MGKLEPTSKARGLLNIASIDLAFNPVTYEIHTTFVR